MSNSYNGLAQMSGLSIGSIIKLIPDTYLYYFESLLRKEGINSLLITILNFGFNTSNFIFSIKKNDFQE